MKKLKKIESCRSCSLCLNQPPLLDNLKKAQVFWVGLSAVKVSDTKKEIPLSSNTNTGKLLSYVEEKNKHVSFYKTNLVKCLPLKENKKIRYPKIDEMKSCFENLQYEINSSKPRVVFLLGKIVSEFIIGIEKAIKPFLDDKFNYKPYKVDNTYYIPIHHPSYILVYKRKYLEKYVTNITRLLANFATN